MNDKEWYSFIMESAQAADPYEYYEMITNPQTKKEPNNTFTLVDISERILSKLIIFIFGD